MPPYKIVFRELSSRIMLRCGYSMGYCFTKTTVYNDLCGSKVMHRHIVNIIDAVNYIISFPKAITTSVTKHLASIIAYQADARGFKGDLRKVLYLA